MAQFERDGRCDHENELETTLYVPTSAHIDRPDVFKNGLNVLMALVLLALPWMVALVQLQEKVARILREQVAYTGGAPPNAPWCSQPPKTAPPFSTWRNDVA